MGVHEAAMTALKKVRSWYDKTQKPKSYYKYGKQVAGKEGDVVKRKKKAQSTLTELDKMGL